MKKLILVLIALCLLGAVVFGAVSLQSAGVATPPPAAEDQGAQNPDAEAGQNPAEGWVMDEIGPLSDEDAAAVAGTTGGALPAAPEADEAEEEARVDFAALYALHSPEEKVLSIGDREETWGDYFYLLYTQASQIENYFDSMAMYYGMRFTWDDPVEEGGATYADAVVESAGNLLKQLDALEFFAEENGVTVTEEMRALIESQKQEDIVSLLGEDGSEEEFYQYLEGQYLSREMYDRAVTQNVLYQESFNALYGENGEKLSDADALAYLEENGYLSAVHILYLYNDPETGEVRDDETLAAKRAELEALAKELGTVADTRTRSKVFLERASKLSEDTGKDYYPEGYTFTPGTMVEAFEEAALALEEYEISGVVETDYGYHVIMRLPLKADAIVEYNSTTGEPRTARMLAANQDYGEKLQALSDSLEVTWSPGCEAPRLQDFIG